MAAAQWNYINIPFPSAISTVRVPFTSETDKNIKALMVEMGKVQRLICSETLQTEVRVLYELLYFLNNSFRGHKAFNCIKQVEQCVNRLKDMKLDVALMDLTDACPQNIQRKLGLRTGECDVPSQPTLEWVCLKVLGAARLSTCTLTRCSKAFVLARKQMKWSEFLVLNMVITSMLSRLWVIFRGFLLCLSTLYQQLLVVLGAVAQSRPMPFLTDFSLPRDLVEFLGPSEAHVLTNHPTFIKNLKRKNEIKSPAEVEIKRKKKKKKEEDLGVAIKRDVDFNSNLKPILSISKKLKQGKSLPEDPHQVEIQKFQKQAKKAASFAHMTTHLEDMMQWCRSQRMKKEEQLLSFLHLKCKRLKKSLEDTQLRKLPSFRRHVCWALSPRGPTPKTFHSCSAAMKCPRWRTRIQILKGRLRSSRLRKRVKGKRRIKRQKEADLTLPLLVENHQHNHTVHEAGRLTANSVTDEIDDIFDSLHV